MKIAIINIWLGRLPANFELWLRSVRYNADYDFLFFTNQLLPDLDFPSNFKSVSCSVEQIKDRIFEKTGVAPILKRGYKLVDFRPAFGVLFEDYLKEYAFWGHCDLDLMFGRLSNFITPEVLAENLKVYIRGHLSLYKNIESVNMMYTRSPRCDYKKIFASEDNYIFDEWAGIGQIFKEFDVPFYHEEELADIDCKNLSFKASNIRNYHKQLFVWEAGHVFQYYLEDEEVKRKELSYVHFQKRLMPIKDKAVLTSEKVLITNSGFYAYEGVVMSNMLYAHDRVNFSHGINRVVRGAKLRFNELFAGVPIVDRSLCE